MIKNWNLFQVMMWNWMTTTSWVHSPIICDYGLIIHTEDEEKLRLKRAGKIEMGKKENPYQVDVIWNSIANRNFQSLSFLDVFFVRSTKKLKKVRGAGMRESEKMVWHEKQSNRFKGLGKKISGCRKRCVVDAEVFIVPNCRRLRASLMSFSLSIQYPTPHSFWLTSHTQFSPFLKFKISE